DNVNVALLGPQVGYTLGKAKKICEPLGIPVDVIPMVDYGMMNGAKVLEFALNLANK
ncbi:PTS sugar transporter subunit IIB, partial [Clostridium beijerinckii]